MMDKKEAREWLNGLIDEAETLFLCEIELGKEDAALNTLKKLNTLYELKDRYLDLKNYKEGKFSLLG